MALVNDAKVFLRDMVRSLNETLIRVAQPNPALEPTEDASRIIMATSQLIGSCDSLATVLVFMRETVPGMHRFAETGMAHVERLRDAAKRVRAKHWKSLSVATPVDDRAHESPVPPSPEPDTSAVEG